MIPLGEVEAGLDLWLKYRPWLRMRVLIRNAVNKRRARLGKEPLPPFTKETLTMIPKGVMTYTGIAILILTPLAAKYGISSDELSTWVNAGGTVLGGLIAIYGRYRATKGMVPTA